MAKVAGMMVAATMAAVMAGCSAQNNLAQVNELALQRCGAAYGLGTPDYFACQQNVLDRYEQRQVMQNAINAQNQAVNLNLMATGLSMMQQPRYPLVTCNTFGTLTNCW